MRLRLLLPAAAVLSAAAVCFPLQTAAQTELGSEDDITVLGTNGTDADPDAEIKGFTVFGATQAAYTGAAAAPGHVVVNGVLAVSSGAYFVGNSTFTGAGKIFITDGSAGQILRKNAAGYLEWDNAAALGDNLGNHTATTTLNMNSWNVVNVSSVNFRANVFVSSATAAQHGGVYVSSNLFVAGLSSATAYYGDGSMLAGVSTDTLKIGDSYGGGVVFWVDSKGRNALIAPTADQSAAIAWAPTTGFTGAQLDGVGAGKANTVMVTTTTGPGSYAARLCADYAATVNGVYYDDWYLPSLVELQLLYAQKTLVGGFVSNGYWSSTEYAFPITRAWAVDFTNGGTGTTLKTNNAYVRCVRGGPVSAFDHLRDAETVRNGAYVNATQTFSGVNTFTQGVTASSYTATGIGVQAAQVRLDAAPGVVISSEASAALGSGVRVSTNVYIVGFASATKFYGDGSELTGLSGLADNLGNHNATQRLNMGGYAVWSSSDITAARYQINGSTVLALLPGAGSLGVGVDAGKINTGGYNSFVGNTAGYSNTTGENNSFVGYQAGLFNTTGGNNSFLGSQAGYLNTAGSSNTISGFQAGYGWPALSYEGNSLYGYKAGFALTIGSFNTLVGSGAGGNVTSGGGNIAIGYNTNVPLSNGNNQLNIGNAIYGDLSAKTIGISTRAPQAALDVVSTGTVQTQFAQIWRASDGVIKASMSATGVMMAAKFVGDGSSLTNISANAGVYTLAQMNTLVPAAAGRLISVSNAAAPYSYCVSTGTAAGAWVLLNQTLHCQ